MNKSTTMLLLCFMILSYPVFAQTPNYLTHQGRIVQTDQTPVTGTDNLTFALYETGQGGDAIWFEELFVAFDNGFYTVILGRSSTFPEGIFDNTNLYMGVTLGNDNELVPRNLLTSVPYAIWARSAKKAAIPTEDDDISPKSYVDTQILEHGHEYASPEHNHGDYAEAIHDHSDEYSSPDHGHEAYSLDTHEHDTLYYTQTQVDTALSNLSEPPEPSGTMIHWDRLTNVPDFGGVNGSGTENYLTKFTGSEEIGSSALYEDESGNLGIGTTSPGAELDVNGNIIALAPTDNNHVATKEYVDALSDDILTDTAQLVEEHGILQYMVGAINAHGRSMSQYSFIALFGRFGLVASWTVSVNDGVLVDSNSNGSYDSMVKNRSFDGICQAFYGSDALSSRIAAGNYTTAGLEAYVDISHPVSPVLVVRGKHSHSNVTGEVRAQTCVTYTQHSWSTNLCGNDFTARYNLSGYTGYATFILPCVR